MSYRKLTIYTLVIAIITLFSMIPSGSVENRSFGPFARLCKVHFCA